MKYVFLLFFSASAMIYAQKPCGFKDGLQEGSCKEFFDNGQVKISLNGKRKNRW